MSADRQALLRVAEPAALGRLQRSASRLLQVLNDSRLELLSVELRAFVDAIRSVSDWEAEFRRRAFLVTERCGPQSRYQEARLNVADQLERVCGEPEGEAGPPDGRSTLKRFLSDSSIAAVPELVPELERIFRKLAAVIDADTLPTPVIDACKEWRGVCDGVLVECRAAETEGCYWLWRAADESAEDPGTTAILRSTNFGFTRQPVIDAVNSLLAAFAAGSQGAAEDESAFRPAKEFVGEHGIKTAGGLTRFLKKHPEIRTRKPKGQRLLIHSGDWMAHWAAQHTRQFEAMDTEILADAESERQRVQFEIRTKKEERGEPRRRL